MAARKSGAGKSAPSENEAEASAGERDFDATLNKPTGEYICKLKDDLSKWYRKDGRNLRSFRDLLKGRKPPGIPEKYRRVDADIRLKDMDEQLTRLTSLIAGHFPKLHVEPLENEGDQQNATKRAMHTQPALEQAARAAGGGNQWLAGARDQLGDGAGIFKLIPRRDMWSAVDYLNIDDYADDEGYSQGKRGSKSKYRKYLDANSAAKKTSGVPVVLTTIDVDTWLPLWEDVGITASLEVTQRNANATLKKYRMGIESDASGLRKVIKVGPGFSQNPSLLPDTVNVIEYWDDEWCMVCVECDGKGEIAWECEHHYGRMPIFPMWGRNFKRGQRRGEPIVENMAGYQEALNTFLTIALNAGLIGAVPPLFHEVPESSDFYTGLDGTEGATRKPAAEEKWDPGTRIMGRPGEKLTPLNVGQVSETVKQLIDRLFEQMGKMGMPRAADAIAGDLEGAGFALNQILADLRAEKSDILDEQMACLREMTLFYWSLIRNPDGIGDVVYVEGVDPNDVMAQKKALVGLAPDDLTEQVAMRWEIDWSQDAAKLVLVRMVHERIEKGTLDMDEGIRMLGSDPDKVNRGKIVDRIRADQTYIDVALEVVKQAVGRGDDNEALKRAISMIQSGASGGVTSPLNPAQQQPGFAQSAGQANAGAGPEPGAATAASGGQAMQSNGAVRGATAGVVVPNPPVGSVA